MTSIPSSHGFFITLAAPDPRMLAAIREFLPKSDGRYPLRRSCRFEQAPLLPQAIDWLGRHRPGITAAYPEGAVRLPDAVNDRKSFLILLRWPADLYA